MKISVGFDDGGAGAVLGELKSIVGDFTPVWPKVDRIVADMETQQFATEGGYGGEQWAPLNPSYAERKRAMYGDSGILRATGRMYNSLTNLSDPEHLFDFGPNFGEFGTRVPYAQYHQSGTSRGLPRRVVIPAPPGEIGEAIVDAFQAYVYNRLSKIGARFRGSK